VLLVIIRRILKRLNNDKKEAAELLDTQDEDRRQFVKHYFGTDWPNRSFYHLMINTAIGEDNAISTILHTMLQLEKGKR